MSEQYVVTVDGREVMSPSASRCAALDAAFQIIDAGLPAFEIAIAEVRTLQVCAGWRRDGHGWRLVGTAPGWLSPCDLDEEQDA